MQKYKRSKQYTGKRAWFKKFAIVSSSGGVNWKGMRPTPSDGVSAETFAPSNRGFSIETVEEYRRIVIRLNDPRQCLTLFYKTGEAYFIHIYLDQGIQFVSKTYPDRKIALACYTTNAVRWIRREAM